MKKIIITIVIFITFISCFFAQETSEVDTIQYKKNYFYLNPLQTVFYTVQLGYEKAFSDNNQSILICFGYYREKPNNNIVTGFSEELQYRFFVSSESKYPSNKFNFDFYFAPYLNHKFYNFDNDIYDTHNLITGIIGGLRFSYKSFTCDLHCGGGYKSIFIKHSNITYNGYHEFADIGYEGILPKLGFQIGYKF